MMTEAGRYGGTGKLLHFQRGMRPMSFPAIAAIDAYWEALRGPRAMPRREELDPSKLDEALPHAFLLERIAPGLARFRLAGMHLNDLMGMEVRGMPVTALLVPEARSPMADIIEDVCDRPAVAVMSLSADRGLGRPALKARAFLAPLQSDGGGGRRIFGGIEAVGGIGRAPRRFVIEELYIRSIDGTQTAVPIPQPTVREEQAPGLAEPATAFRAAQPGEAAGGARPPLYLIKND